MFNMLGSPALSVPIGKSTVTNMPLGIQFVASPFNEAILISMAKELEKAFGGWVTPGKMPKELMEAMNL
jgi:fatty acid amide hydrolase 2